mmetsp:Transcript_13457/g.38094  ORF Transcript_13457/g.38094 Transcript_13457/m.38094 type:complete len:249 (-) Transcript_13457:1280-2026(-)
MSLSGLLGIASSLLESMRLPISESEARPALAAIRAPGLPSLTGSFSSSARGMFSSSSSLALALCSGGLGGDVETSIESPMYLLSSEKSSELLPPAGTIWSRALPSRYSSRITLCGRVAGMFESNEYRFARGVEPVDWSRARSSSTYLLQDSCIATTPRPSSDPNELSSVCRSPEPALHASVHLLVAASWLLTNCSAPLVEASMVLAILSPSAATWAARSPMCAIPSWHCCSRAEWFSLTRLDNWLLPS